VEQGDSALATTTFTASNTTPVGLQVESMGEFESMATEMAGPMATHPNFYQREAIPPWVGMEFLGLRILP